MKFFYKFTVLGDQTQERNAEEHKDRIQIHPCISLSCGERQHERDTTQCGALARIVNRPMQGTCIHVTRESLFITYYSVQVYYYSDLPVLIFLLRINTNMINYFIATDHWDY